MLLYFTSCLLYIHFLCTYTYHCTLYTHILVLYCSHVHATIYYCLYIPCHWSFNRDNPRINQVKLRPQVLTVWKALDSDSNNHSQEQSSRRSSQKMSSMVNLGMFTNEGSNITSTFAKRTLWKLGSAETSYPQIGLSTNQRNFTPKRIETVKKKGYSAANFLHKSQSTTQRRRNRN